MNLVLRLALAALVVVALAACTGAAANPSGVASLGSPTPGADSSAAPEASMDPEDAAIAFAECMREQGVEMPDPKVGPNGEMTVTINGGPGSLDQEEMQAAHEACQHLMPGPRGEPRELSPEEKDAMLAFAQCMRDHGIDMPDPVFDGGGGVMIGPAPAAGGNGGPAFERDSGEFQEAAEACRELHGDLLPGGGPVTNVEPGEGTSGSESETKP